VIVRKVIALLLCHDWRNRNGRDVRQRHTDAADFQSVGAVRGRVGCAVLRVPPFAGDFRGVF
jgi:hypothetical protein